MKSRNSFPQQRGSSTRSKRTKKKSSKLRKWKSISRERIIADKMQRLEAIRIRGHFNYDAITQLSTEARQKLTAIDPETLAQAGRIPGVSPSDISVLLVLLGR